VRTFETGATRSAIDGKLRYEGYFSPLVLRERAEYMRRHQVQEDGSLREPDNWQRGIPTDSLMDSAFRHFMDWWSGHRGHASRSEVQEALCALMFNAEAYLHAMLTEPVVEVEVETTVLRDSTTWPAPFGGCMGDPDPEPVLTVAGSDEPLPLPTFGPGSPAATTGGPDGRVYAGEGCDPDHEWTGTPV
jgi:hypothetical protein